jgi:glutamine synthetase
MNPEVDFVLKTIESRDVHFVRLWFPDVLGNMKSFAVVPSEMSESFEHGMGFDASCIEGFSHIAESDMLAFPDPSTFQVLPWRPQSNAVARMMCNIRTPEGEPYAGDSRQVLMRMVNKAASLGYVFMVGPEIEYFYFKDATAPEVLDQGSYFDLTTLDSASDLRRDTVLALERMGIPVEYSHHEKGPSQHEIDLRYADGLSMADAVMTYKLVVKEIAHAHGVYASFMPKPLGNAPGNGMHVHQSLLNFEGENLFFDENDPLGYNLSPLAKNYIAGLLKYAPEFTLVTNQYVNSYKRLTCPTDAPSCLSWGARNRAALVRIPGYRPHAAQASRVELRSPDPSANPYLAFAVMLAAGLRGIEEGLELQPPTHPDGLVCCTREVGDCLCDVGSLPHNLGEAVELFAESELMKETLGEHIHSYLVRAKRAEWREYQQQVTEWELKKNLAVL